MGKEYVFRIITCRDMNMMERDIFVFVHSKSVTQRVDKK